MIHSLPFYSLEGKPSGNRTKRAWWGVRTIALVAMAVGAIALSGCSTPALPTRLYVLTPLTQVEPVSRAPGVGDVTIGVGPVELPQYVNRPEVVTGRDSPALQSAASAQWA